MDARQAALELAHAGFRVFPISPRGKVPVTAHGCKDGSTDPAAVQAMFRPGVAYNVGVATGADSGYWVLDVEAAGRDDFARLQEEHGAIPDTVTAITGGGGRHYFFATGAYVVKNRQKVGRLPIDVRGEGGYVVAPPSVHASGRTYEWERRPGDAPLVTAPSWLLDFVSVEPSHRKASPRKRRQGKGPSEVPRSGYRVLRREHGADTWATIPPGEEFDALYIQGPEGHVLNTTQYEFRFVAISA